MSQTSPVALLKYWFVEAEFDTTACPEYKVATLGLLGTASRPVVWHRRDLRWAFIPTAVEIAGAVFPFFGEGGAFGGEAEAAVVQGFDSLGDGIPYMPSNKRPDVFLTVRVVIVGNECTVHFPRQRERFIVRHPTNPASSRPAGKPGSALKLPRRPSKQSDVEKAFQ